MSFNQAQIGHATKWSTITELSIKLIAPLINMILARLLTPDAFGAVATISMIISFAEIFADAGFQKYLIQHEFENEDDLNQSTNVAFWTNITISAFLWIIIILFRNQIANWAGNADLGDGVAVAAAAMIAISFSSIQMARFKRDFDFKSLFFMRLSVTLIPLVITVPLTFFFRNFWALVIGTLSAKIMQAVILMINSKWKPKFSYSWNKLHEMFSFSMWTLLEMIAIWLTSNIGVFIVGNFLDAHYLGLYKTTMTTVNAYMAIITGATTPVLFSALSRMQNHEADYRQTFFTFQRSVAILVLPMGAGLYFYRALATQLLLGAQWAETADFLGLWALMSGITIVFAHYGSEIYRSKGRPKISLLVQGLHLLTLIPALYISARVDFHALYVTRSLIRIQSIAVHFILMWRIFHFNPWDMIKNVSPALFATAGMSLFAFFTQPLSLNMLWQFISIALCIVIYFTLILLQPTSRKELLEYTLIKKLMKKFSMHAG